MIDKKDILKEVKCGTKNHPFDTVLVAFAECLPHGFFLWRFSGDTDSGATAVRSGRVLLDFAEFDSLGRDVMAGVGEIEHAPEGCIGIGLGDLEEGEIRRVWGGERKLVDGRDDACVGYGPFKVARGLTPDDTSG